MDLKKSLEKIINYENEFKPLDIRVDNIPIWPILRYLELGNVKNFENKNFENNFDYSKLLPRKPNFLKYFYSKIKLKYFELKLRQNLRNLNPITSIFLSNISEHYTTKLKGKYLNQNIDPYLFSFDKVSKKNIKISLFLEIERLFNVENINQKLVHKILSTKIIIYNHKKIFKNLDWSKFKKSNIEFDEDQLKFLILKLLASISIYKLIFKVLKPDNLFVACYYSLLNSPAIIAANNLGINTIDIQHGKQGVYHHFYNHFSELYFTNNPFLPKYFWLWDEKFKINITKWFSKDIKFPKIIIGGNLWLEEFNKILPMKYYENKLKLKKNLALIALQPIKDLNYKLLKNIIENNQNITFLIRFHPIQKNGKQEISSQFKNYKNVKIKIANELPLFFLLKKVDFVITYWSTVCLDALEFGKKSILIHENGFHQFKSYIEEGYLEYSCDKIAINKIIKKIKRIKISKSSFKLTTKEIINLLRSD